MGKLRPLVFSSCFCNTTSVSTLLAAVSQEEEQYLSLHCTPSTLPHIQCVFLSFFQREIHFQEDDTDDTKAAHRVAMGT